MRISRRLFSPFSSLLTHKLDYYAGIRPSSLSIQEYIDFGRRETAKTSFVFVRNELLVRLANIMKEMTFLPPKLLNMPSVAQVNSWYCQSFEDLLKFENSEAEFYMVSRFNEQLKVILKRHNDVVRTMAAGLLELRNAGGIDFSNEKAIQYFLDRFYTNRISKRMLKNQHLLVFGSNVAESPNHIGHIDPKCDVGSVIRQAFVEAQYVCDYHYKVCPPIEFQLVNKRKPNHPVTVVSVPSHLSHIMFELFKNAMRATVEYHPDWDSDELPPVRVTVICGKHDLTVQVSDRGGGFPRSHLDRIFNFMYSTAPTPLLHDNNQPAMAGYGYGLPLSRLYARYFLGDLVVAPMEGYGTDAYVHLKAIPVEASEVLPIYGESSRLRLTEQVDTNDWSHHLPVLEQPSLKRPDLQCR